jgi:hypothetical protein
MKGKKAPGRPFKKGQSGNPSGRPKLPQDLLEAKKLTQIEFERIVNKYLFEGKQKLAQAAADPGTTVLELLIGSIIHKAVIEGDEKRMEFLLNRIVGKVTERIGGPNGEPIEGNTRIIVIPSNGREAK